MTRSPYVTFTVEGAGSFPFDMLRYDGCYPRSERDSAAIKADGRRTVTLIARERFSPTTARWESFLWRVIETDGMNLPRG